MMKSRAWLATAVASTVALSTLVALPATAATADTLSVDFSQSTGSFRGGASGTLYGLGDEGAPTQALINGARVTNTSQKAPFGTQHPSGDSLKIEDGFFAKHGKELDIYVQDYYPDWAYNSGRRPGDDRTYNQATGAYTNTPNGVWDYLEVVEFVTEAVATQSDYPEKYVFIPFNEPDGGNWYGDWAFFNQYFMTDWKAAYDKINEVYARHDLPKPVIGGPGDAAWRADRTAVWLDYVKQTDTIPQFMIWHELGIDNLATYRAHYDEYRSMEAARGIEPLQINITEYGLLRDMGVPGQLIQWFSMFEDTKVDAQTAYWNYAGNFSDNSARPNGANAGWWMFKWYGDLAGSKTVKVTPPQLNAVDTLQGIGAVDADDRRATVLYGGSSADTVNLSLAGLSSDVFGSKVDVEVREAPLTGAEGLSATPRLIATLDGVDVVNGSVQVSVPNYDRYAGYQVIVTPEQDRALTAEKTWSTTVEAEDTVLSGARTYTQSPTASGGWNFLASGGQDVGSFNNASSKSDWTVDVPRDGTYRYQVIGATPGQPGRHALFVDGAKAATVQYTADLALNNTSRWKYRGSAEVTVNLTKGSHTLSLRASEDGVSVLPNSDITLDRFVLTDVTDGEITAYPASTMRLAGTAELDYDRAGLRGSALIGADGRADVYATAFESGYYDVRVDYASGGAADVKIDVNGRRIAATSSAGAGVWATTARVHLSEGINELELHSDAGISVTAVTTTRVKAADSAAVKVEAESGTVAGVAKKTTIASNTGTNASGGTVVDWLGNGANNVVTIPRAAGFDQPGDYNIVVKYSNAEVSGAHAYNPQVVDRRLQVAEGGNGQVGYGYFRYTYSWNSFWERTIPVTLKTGGGALTFGNEGAFAPNVDYIIVAPTVLGQPKTEVGVNSAPVISPSLSPKPNAEGWATAPVTVTATATDDSGQPPAVSYRVNGGQYAPSSAGVSLSDEGFHVVGVQAVDGQGASSSTEVPVKIDRTAPLTSALAAPSSGTVPAGQTVTATFSAADATSGIASTEYSVDGGVTWTETTDAGVSFTEEGTHVVAYRSTDVAGNVEQAKQVTLTVARPENVVKVTTTSADAPSSDGWYQQNVLIKLEAPKAGQKVQYRVNDGAWRAYSSSINVSTNGSSKIDYRLLVSNVVVAESEGQTVVNIDKTLPTATATRTPASGTGTPRNPISVAFAATDATSGVGDVQYRVNSGQWQSVGGAPIPFDQVGDYVVSYRATDKAGNVSQAKSLSFSIKENAATSVKASAKTVKPGAAVTLALSGFARWDDVTVTFGGTPLTTLLTDVNGAAKVTVKVPTTAANGATAIVATGTDAATGTVTVTIKK